MRQPSTHARCVSRPFLAAGAHSSSSWVPSSSAMASENARRSSSFWHIQASQAVSSSCMHAAKRQRLIETRSIDVQSGGTPFGLQAQCLIWGDPISYQVHLLDDGFFFFCRLKFKHFSASISSLSFFIILLCSARTSIYLYRLHINTINTVSTCLTRGQRAI